MLCSSSWSPTTPRSSNVMYSEFMLYYCICSALCFICVCCENINHIVCTNVQFHCLHGKNRFSVLTWDPHLGPLFRSGTHTWVLCSNLGPTRGSPIQTWDPHLSALLRSGTHTWVLCSNLGPTPGTSVEIWDPHLGP